MQKFLLVDGYNMIFSWELLRKLAQEDLQYARDKLVHMLANYQGYVGEYIIVVFDAYNVKGNVGQIIHYNRYVDIIYTKEKETADQYIEKTARVLNRKYSVKVATSDATEQVIILGAGAIRVSAMELFEDILLKKKATKKYISTHKEVKKNPLENWMDEDVLNKIQQLRRGKME